MRDISLDEMKNEVKELYKHKLISIGYAGDFESLLADERNESNIIEKIPGMYEMYQDAVATWADYKEDKDDDDYNDWDKPVKSVVPTEPKIGRNDPCPCGSGKKYKKCCLKDV